MSRASTTSTPTPPDVGHSSVAQSSDAQLFLLVEIGKVLAVRNTLYEALLKYANEVMQGQISAGYGGAKALATSAETSFWTQAAGQGLQIGVNGYGATAGVRGYKNIEDAHNNSAGGIKDLESKIQDIDQEFSARERNGNGAVRMGDQDGTPALEARRAGTSGGAADSTQTPRRNPNLDNVSHPELQRRKETLKRQLDTKKAELEKALEQHKAKLDRATQITMGISGIAKSSGDTISQDGQAEAQAENTTNSISKDAQQYLNSTAQGQEQTGNSFAQAAGQAMAASQATAGR